MGRSREVALGSNREPTKWHSWRHSIANRFAKTLIVAVYILIQPSKYILKAKSLYTWSRRIQMPTPNLPSYAMQILAHAHDIVSPNFMMYRQASSSLSTSATSSWKVLPSVVGLIIPQRMVKSPKCSPSFLSSAYRLIKGFMISRISSSPIELL